MEARLIKLEEFASETRERLAKIELRLEQTATKADIETLSAALRAEIHKSSTEVLRWMIATVVAMFVGLGGLFFVTGNAAKNPAPIIIHTEPAAKPPPSIPP